MQLEYYLLYCISDRDIIIVDGDLIFFDICITIQRNDIRKIKP